MADVQVVHRPHLVLTDIGGYDGVVIDKLVDLVHDPLGCYGHALLPLIAEAPALDLLKSPFL